GPQTIVEIAPLVIPAAVEKAREFWATCSTENQLLSAIEKLTHYYDKDLPEGRSKFRMFVPHELAMSFVLSRDGQTDEALALFEANAERFQYKPKVKEKIKSLLMEAANA